MPTAFTMSPKSELLPNGQPIPEGHEFLELIWSQEDDCEKDTDARFPEFGVKAPKCLNELGTVLSRLNRLASCWWGCRGGDHIEEYLVGRALTNARASLRLLKFGFYDESLTLTRNIGEVANLFYLFATKPDSCEQWRSLDSRSRQREFGPVAVRKKLEAAGKPIPIDQTLSKGLSEIGVHPTPDIKPEAHNPLGIPMVAHLQEAGALLALNEYHGL